MSKRHSASNPDLKKYAAKPVARLLIETARRPGIITYKGVAKYLVRQHNFGNGDPNHTSNLPRRMNYAAERAMDRLIGAFGGKRAKLPLLTMVMVSKAEGLPGGGAKKIVANHFGYNKIGEKGAPKTFKEAYAMAQREVYDFPDWKDLYCKAFGQPWKSTGHFKAADSELKELPNVNGRGGGEGLRHKALKKEILEHPEIVLCDQKPCYREDEYWLFSGDKVDVVFCLPNEIIAVEVKPEKSGPCELQRGIYQCVKYRAVLEAQKQYLKKSVRSILVTEENLPKDLQAVAKRLNIKTVVHRVN